MNNAIGWREWTKGGDIYFVESLPGHGGKDWGYTTDPSKAMGLNEYWQRRFRRDCERVGYEAHFFSRTAYKASEKAVLEMARQVV